MRIANHWYSVPWKLAGKFVDVQLFDDYLDVFYDGEIVASHR
ncbi:Mu transposase domain-containing protein [Corynebacterium striatum]